MISTIVKDAYFINGEKLNYKPAVYSIPIYRPDRFQKPVRSCYKNTTPYCTY